MTELLSARLEAQVGELTISAQFSLDRGTLVLLGPNGSGKTTILSLLLGLLPVQKGKLTVSGTVLFDSEARSFVPVERRRLGYVPQDYCLFPHLTVYQNVLFAARCSAVRKSAASLREFCLGLLDDLGLVRHAERRIHTLSGGEKQRAALARALAIEPVALFLDEPLAALDVRSREEVRAYLRETLEALNIPTIVITHDPADARVLAHRIALVERGRITETGSFEELARNSKSDFVRQFTELAPPALGPP